MSDDLGDRMKLYESTECDRIAMPRLPIYARLDGKCFSNFTRNMNRPYDERMSRLMIETTKYLVEETGAVTGYTQSDEISLAWFAKEVRSQPLFGGKTHKLTSILPAMATAQFITAGLDVFPDEIRLCLPCFDCRVFALPSLDEAANAFLWRELDATKNSVSMAARHYFSHKELHGKDGKQKQEMLFQAHRINFNDYPAFFKRGTFVRRVVEERELSTEELQQIPAQHRPTGKVTRSTIVELDMPKFLTVTNRVGVIFHGEAPRTEQAA